MKHFGTSHIGLRISVQEKLDQAHLLKLAHLDHVSNLTIRDMTSLQFSMFL